MITSPVVPSSLTQSPVSIIENTSVSGGKSVTAGISNAAVATPQRESMLEKSIRQEKSLLLPQNENVRTNRLIPFRTT